MIIYSAVAKSAAWRCYFLSSSIARLGGGYFFSPSQMRSTLMSAGLTPLILDA